MLGQKVRDSCGYGGHGRMINFKNSLKRTDGMSKYEPQLCKVYQITKNQ